MEIDQQLQQQINIKFLVKLDKSGPEICQMLQKAYREGRKKSHEQRKVRAPFHFAQR
jgi:hypothetical protein